MWILGVSHKLLIQSKNVYTYIYIYLYKYIHVICALETIIQISKNNF